MSVSLLPPTEETTSKQQAEKPQPISAPARKRSKTAFFGVALLLIILLIAGILPRLKRHNELAAMTHEQEQSLPVVTVAGPRKAEATNELILPATTQAIQETMIYARHGGYVRRWLAGMGQDVRAGQLLAEISAPESDQQLGAARQEAVEAEQTVTQTRSELGQVQASLEQAEASLKQARTNLELARVNLERSKTLVAQGVVSQQDTDDKQALYDARQADLEAAQANIRARQAAVKAQQSAIDSKAAGFKARQANVQRLEEIHSFQRVVAPYDGTITARNVEVGVLISATGATPTGTGLFRLAKMDIIRVFINVPQTYVTAMEKGLPAEVQVKELPQKVFTGNVIGTSHYIDPATRTLMVEVRVPNPTRQLLPGMYAQVKFALPSVQDAVIIPATALVANAEGTQVLTLRPDQTVHVQKIEVGRDYGKEIEVIAGLQGDESIITNPSDALHEGTRVQVSKTK
ncbi:MAG: efflux RND transporter periplasmic adaptor subunit [Acidobacteria bacterium]|nr:efflux RND transporter periplasmic adaptor subunit [Acidobacteriota bacterium]